mmetsp:Transcript_23010/g.41060  ORF Transcript_23010/g.41060 Transcript_23010/m.41060 type:complete len:160 (-) Transcript_23010:396-875(-)|eukprot:CAMPEP_0201621530 /NCGR_PEP_ID=MMETSP0492-20130828/46933_1 /ASSEMBLY_ACC=CAM_ASM_000837 /TAXON_ID=420259 /ORGANISM="Thalassiosira gravida, Strain GMp14c1" /LENGTH=159 /DNA_ID=CAMNT_0048091079 /DNA_START=524 /DNA_END=1003 /DNA_ORIENTATION=+
MLRLVQSPAIRRATRSDIHLLRRRTLSSASATAKKSSPPLLAGDAGRKATHLHHHLTTLLALSFPLYLLTPSSYVDGTVDKTLGLVVSTAIAGHSWIGLNYVATDYVPKIGRGLVGPARVMTALMGVVTMVGLGKVAVNEKGGVRGAVKALWRPAGKKD